MADESDRFVNAITELDDVADALTPGDARQRFDDATLQVFWRQWPHISSWAGALWRALNEDLAQAATPPTEPDLDETGEGGGG